MSVKVAPTSVTATPPGPVDRLFGFEFLRRYNKNRLGTLYSLYKDYGDFVQFNFGPLRAYLVSNPEHLHQVLISDADSYYKVQRTKDNMGRFIGNGILLSDGDFWRRQRKLIQPAFHHKRIEAYAQYMVASTQQHIAEWTVGETRDTDQDMMRIALAVVAKTLFDVDSSDMWQDIESALTYIQEATAQDAYEFLPKWLPHLRERSRRYTENAERMYSFARRIINERRSANEDRGDLLSMLLMARDEDGAGMTDQQLLDETMTLMLAGHDTSALTLTWLWYELASNPAAEARLHEELDRVLGDRPPTMADLANLPYLEMVVKETLRMYPAAWAYVREVIRDTKIGNYPVKTGATIVISPYAFQRNPAIFDDPEQFNPERFAHEKDWPKLAYLPFSAGPRVCIGNSFAQMEARLVTATIAQRYRLVKAPGFTAIADGQITLRMKEKLPLRVEARR
jgi:cytochrome P450